MDLSNLIPSIEAIPAPAWIFLVLNVLTFILHILLMNIIVGGSLIILFSRLGKSEGGLERSFHGSIVGKLPSSFALTVNLGIAPLLFVQVIYGHLFYTSSVLMAIYWILIIPLLIIAYYGAYIHFKKYSVKLLSTIAIFISSLILLYIAFVFVNNMTLMLQPEKWHEYFNHRGGMILNWTDSTFLPRYLHFLTASVAVSGLFTALVWWIRRKKNIPNSDEKIKIGLKIFGIATAIQIIIGFWFLLALPSEFILQFMGQNLLYTIFLFAGILFGIGAMILAFLNKFIPTVIHLLVTIILMAITRANLRSLYLDDVFQLNSLQLSPQYGVMILFFLTFIIGLGAVAYMLKISNTAKEGRAK